MRLLKNGGFEYAGEGDRRWTLIRSGYLPEDIKRIKDMTKAMMDGLATKGYYEFEMVISFLLIYGQS